MFFAISMFTNYAYHHMIKVEHIRWLMVIPPISFFGTFIIAFLPDSAIARFLSILLGLGGLFTLALAFLSFYWGWFLRKYTSNNRYFYASITLFIVGGISASLSPFFAAILPWLCYSIMAMIGLGAKAKLLSITARVKSVMEFEGDSLNSDRIARQEAKKQGIDVEKDYQAFYKIRNRVEEEIVKIASRQD